MATSYTALLGLALPVTGELQGTWGTTVNNSITQLCEDSIAGVATASVLSADWTLTTTGSGAANQARMAILIPTGSPGVSRNIIAPSQSKTYTVINQSNAAVVLKGAATTGVTIASGDTVIVAWNGSDFVAVKYASNSYTNLTVSGTLTLSGGTANGVAYLNASKQVTTGSALTFDGTNLNTTGSVILNNAQYYNGKTSGGTNVRLLGINSGDTAYVGAIDAGPTSTIFNASSTSIFASFYASGSEQMRLTSTGLGIGTSSPSYKLDVAGIARSDSWIGRSNTSAPATDAFIYRPADNTLGFGTASSEKMRLDSSGNLGLGVTPSAWSSSWKAFQFGPVGAAFSNSSNAIWSGNEYLNSGGTPTYLTTQYALRYRQDVGSGYHAWYTAPSGTAGNAISWTQAMTLDASGNLGIGATGAITGGSRRALTLNSPSGQLSILELAVNGTLGGYIYSNASQLTFNAANPTPITFETGNTERMRIDSSGNVGIGTSSPNTKLDVNGIINVRTNGYEFGRITTNNVSASTGGLTFQYNSAGTFTDGLILNGGGNLGLGVTPSAWSGVVGPALEFAYGSSIAPQSNSYNLHLLRNAYFNGGWKYKNSAPAARFALNDDAGTGGFAWFYAPSGTAGNAISFTQAMTLDASGNLLVGTTTSQGTFTIGSNSSTASGQFGSPSTIALKNYSGSSAVGGTIIFGADTNTTSAGYGASIYYNNVSSSSSGTSGAICFATKTNATDTALTERMRIDSSGNLLVGTTVTTLYNQTSGTGVCYRKGASLDVLSTSDNCIILNRTTTSGQLQEFRYSGSIVGNISTNGSTITFSGTALSDARWKENITTISNALDAISKLNFVTFNYKTNGQASAGIIAQQAKTVDAIKPFVIDGISEDDYKAVDYNAIISYLGKAIQEQQAIIESLTARITTLEAK